MKQFLKQVPTAWDETRVLGGEPGNQLIIARRARDVWYVAGINGRSSAETFVVAFNFLGGGEWTYKTIADGRTSRDFSTSLSGTLKPGALAGLTIPVHSAGGFVMRIERSRQKDYR